MSEKKLMSPLAVAMYGILIALVAAMTYIWVAIPATKGYFNLGEIMIFFTAFLIGGKAAGICGAIGASFADAILGPIFIPATIVAKGSEGYIAGLISKKAGKGRSKIALRATGFAVGGSLMVLTYFLYEWLIFSLGIYSTESVTEYGALGAALVELPFNIFQVLLCGTIALMLAEGIERSYPRISELRNL